MVELWFDVKGYEFYYKVSNLGNIARCEGRGRKRRIKPKFHKSTGYFVVNLSMRGKTKTHRVHRLVAEAFLDPIEGSNQVNHIDGNGLNNEVSNLEWVTASENVEHALDCGLSEYSNMVILENQDTKELIKLNSMTKASKFIGRSPNYISQQTKKGNFNIDGFNVYVMFRN